MHSNNFKKKQLKHAIMANKNEIEKSCDKNLKTFLI